MDHRGHTHGVNPVDEAGRRRWQACCDCGWAGSLLDHRADADRQLDRHNAHAYTHRDQGE